MKTRTERDSMGEVQVPDQALYGAQTQRAINNFPISGQPLPPAFIYAIARIKAACAHANGQLARLEQDKADAIIQAAGEIIDGRYPDAFPIDVYQTGSGTSTNMNVNEVLAHLAAARLGKAVGANDDVNMGQSSNDVIPSAIHVSAALSLSRELLPALHQLEQATLTKAEKLQSQVKTGRTHLMDAMPLRFDQELGGWATQVRYGRERLGGLQSRLQQLALGGTAIGTGINADPRQAQLACDYLNRHTGLDFCPAEDYFYSLSSQDTAVELSGQLKTLAVALMKIANDLRWMNSGPLTGLAEIQLTALQPGSSIMPGKVNPVIPEAVAMVAAQVIGLDTAITVAGQSGNFQLNVMLPLVANNLLTMTQLLTNVAPLLADAIAGFTVNQEHIDQSLAKNPILVTALNPVIGYDRAAKIAKQAYAENRPILEVALEETELSEEELRHLLDPAALTRGSQQE
ncbi:class II fumarate hydratase [Oceanisphaera arctica]|uniref:Fumarate hydratase class II n=1 Tax=Oceanisphaera arctica TaxID=641510 RepID=A0A2P5TIM5_9GAMM|nr:class II fumarate hydratase [Oceanisphaera arctica]PPL14667.1 aspartate ammonia-lyase [Oceanisphaera arctica]GHA15687.1 fumarate hydratase class II 1 [Oceanisphaera arctica]